ncbi:MAG: amphi-Trp domain-containing protein [Halohasta sp.]
MAEETLFEIEGAQDRTTIADYFRQFADGLEADGEVTFSTDQNEATVTIPETAEFEIEIEEETEDDETEYEIEFEIEWSESESIEAVDTGLSIEAAGGGHETAPTADDEQETIDEAGDEGESE